MPANTASSSKNTRIEYDIDEVSSEKVLKASNNVQGTPLIKSEAEYSQSTQKTRDAGTELDLETDDVNVTTEIYSQTDLPSSLQPSEQTPPKPGTIVPEYHDGMCMILRAYRCKCVNTIESYDPLNPLKCTFPSIEIQEDFSHSRKNLDAENVHAFRLTTFPYAPEEISQINPRDILCHKSCPNLIITQASQTDDSLTVCRRPEDQGDSAEISASIEVPAKHTRDGRISSELDSLTTIEEANEESEGYETVEELSETEDDETEKHNEQSLTTSQMNSNQSISEESTEELPTNVRKTHDIATGDSDLFYSDAESKRKSRRSSTSIFEMGTMLTSHSTTWLDRPKRRGNCRLVSARASETCCCDSRLNDNTDHSRRLAQPLMNHCTVQCELIRGNGRSCYSVDDRRTSSESLEYCPSRCFVPGTRCSSVESDSWREPNEFWPTADYRTRRNSRDFGSYREPFIRNQLCRINNSQRCSMTGGALENCAQNRSNRNNACNRYYLNLNKAYNAIGRYCLCNNGYNIRNANAYWCAAGSQAVYHSPNRCHYSFNAWY